MKENPNYGTIMAILVISSISILMSTWNWSNNISNRSRIDNAIEILANDSIYTKNRDSLVNKLNMKSFKEDFYDHQLDIQSNWFITFVSILFTLFGIVGFTYFHVAMNEVKDKITESNDKQKERMRTHKDEMYERFLDFEDRHSQITQNLHFLMGYTYSASALVYGESGNSLNAVNFKLRAVLEYLKGLGEDDYSDENLKSLNSHIDEMEKYISNANIGSHTLVISASYYEELETIFIDLVRLTRNHDSAKRLHNLIQPWRDRMDITPE